MKTRRLWRLLPLVAVAAAATSAKPPGAGALQAREVLAEIAAAPDWVTRSGAGISTDVRPLEPRAGEGLLFSAAYRANTRASTGPVVDIMPKTQTVTVDSIQATVRMCVIWPYDWVIATRSFIYNGNDASSQFQDVTSQLGQPAECNGPNDMWEWWRATLPVELGANTLTVQAIDQGNYAGGDVVEYYRAPPVLGVSVRAAKTQTVRNIAGAAATADFTVTNTGEDSATFNVAAACGKFVSCGNLSASSVWLNAGSSGTVTLSYTTPATAGSKLTAQFGAGTAQGGLTASATTWFEVIAVAAPPTGGVIAQTALGGTPTIERSLCVRGAAGPGLMVECGELRTTHSLPAVRTLNTPRVPLLLYSSEHAHPKPLLQVDVNVPLTSGTLQAVLDINSTQVTRSWTISDPNQHLGPWRIAIDVDAATWATGLYPYSLVLKTSTGGSFTPIDTLSGKLPVVNHRESPFGAGWWLAGVERIYGLGSEGFFWVGGDGSTRLYAPAATNVWLAANVDRADTLIFDGSSYYYRHLPNGEKVKFDATGLHVATINRLGYQTALGWTSVNGRDVLSTLDMPVISGTTRYSFNYNGSGQLTSVDAPSPSGSGYRTTNVTPDATTGRIASIKDPSGDSVRFGYDGTITRRMTSRIDRRSHTTTVAYSGDRVSASTVNPGGLGLTTTFHPLEVVGRSGWTRTDAVMTIITTPRTDLTAKVMFTAAHSGAVDRMVDATGRETLSTYGNSTFPALPTRVHDPSRFVTEAVYNARGLVDTLKAINPLGTSQNALTVYQWHSTLDLPTRIISPLGENAGTDARFQYHSNGNREWQQTGRDSTRVNFYYHSSGLLAKAVVPGIDPDSLAYDGTRGNVSYHRASNGAVSNTYTDAVGRDTLVTVPIDGSNSGWVKNVYDAMDRTIRTITWGPALGNAPLDSMKVEMEYDKEGNQTYVRRFPGTVSSGAGTQVSQYQYDAAGRMNHESHPGRGISYYFGDGVNVTQRSTILGDITMKYDAAGRLVRRIVPQKTYGTDPCSNWITQFTCYFSFPTTGASSVCVPADTARFAYDASGRMLKADNGRARVLRTYKPNGLLASEAQAIRTYHSPGGSPCEVNPNASEGWPVHNIEWTTHVTTLTPTYDLDGRRTKLKHSQGTIQYSYDNVGRGLLTSISDSGHTTTSFGYDAAGRIRTATHPGSVSETRNYASDGFLYSRAVGGFIADTLLYDKRGLITSALGGGLSATIAYNGLGAVVEADDHVGIGPSAEQFTVDALGNRLKRRQVGLRDSWHPDKNGVRLMTYDGNARIVAINDTIQNSDFLLSETYAYDDAGVLTLQYSRELDGIAQTNIYDQTRSYPAVDEKISVVNRHVGIAAVSNEDFPGRHQVYQENWYDALGRRVLVRARKSSACNAGTHGEVACKSFIERTSWDGDQILIEKRSNGAQGLSSNALDQGSGSSDAWGTVVSVHAHGIDQPVVVRKLNRTSIAPHANWMGDYQVGTTANGTVTTSCGGTTDCPVLFWPGSKQTIDGMYMSHPSIDTWWGGLITEKADPSGYKYMRNRYYNPATGQFTQADPIGLAGGVNLYGFAGGDPVNFGDPFGLCPEDLTGRPCLSPLGRTGLRIWSPAANPLRGSFGETRRNQDGSPRSHQGVDLLRRRGSPVTAADEGRVIYAGTQRGHGNIVIIGHQNAAGRTVSWTAYAHLETIDVAEGERVTAGQTLGTVGRTGNVPADAPDHLHFEIRTANPPGPKTEDRRDPKNHLPN